MVSVACQVLKALSPAASVSTSRYDADSHQASLATRGKPAYTSHQQLGVPLSGARTSEKKTHEGGAT